VRPKRRMPERTPLGKGINWELAPLALKPQQRIYIVGVRLVGKKTALLSGLWGAPPPCSQLAGKKRRVRGLYFSTVTRTWLLDREHGIGIG